VALSEVIDRAHKPPAVLVVEDEDLLRMDLVETLEEAGFRTFEAASAEGAIRILEANPQIELLFTDVHMPGSMDGAKLAHYVRGRWPPVRIVVTSGNWLPEPGALPEGADFIPKPYRTSDLPDIFMPD
jgi:CheY-like chemotaxis protein